MMEEGENDYYCDDNELSLAFRAVDSIPLTVTQRARGVRTVNLTETRIKSLASLAHFDSLETLILDKNGLSSLVDCPALRDLRTLWFNNNHVRDLAWFVDGAATRFPRLEYLSLMGNPASPDLTDEAAVERYRIAVAKRLPGLVVLDSTEFTDAERRAAGGLRRRPLGTPPLKKGGTAPDVFCTISLDNTAPRRTRLLACFEGGPGSRDSNSEGNRFIRNNAL